MICVGLIPVWGLDSSASHGFLSDDFWKKNAAYLRVFTVYFFYISVFLVCICEGFAFRYYMYIIELPWIVTGYPDYKNKQIAWNKFFIFWHKVAKSE